MARALATMVHFEMGLSDVRRESALFRVTGVSRRKTRQRDEERSLFQLTLNQPTRQRSLC